MTEEAEMSPASFPLDEAHLTEEFLPPIVGWLMSDTERITELFVESTRLSRSHDNNRAGYGALIEELGGRALWQLLTAEAIKYPDGFTQAKSLLAGLMSENEPNRDLAGLLLTEIWLAGQHYLVSPTSWPARLPSVILAAVDAHTGGSQPAALRREIAPDRADRLHAHLKQVVDRLCGAAGRLKVVATHRHATIDSYLSPIIDIAQADRELLMLVAGPGACAPTPGHPTEEPIALIRDALDRATDQSENDLVSRLATAILQTIWILGEYQLLTRASWPTELADVVVAASRTESENGTYESLDAFTGRGR